MLKRIVGKAGVDQPPSEVLTLLPPTAHGKARGRGSPRAGRKRRSAREGRGSDLIQGDGDVVGCLRSLYRPCPAREFESFVEDSLTDLPKDHRLPDARTSVTSLQGQWNVQLSCHDDCSSRPAAMNCRVRSARNSGRPRKSWVPNWARMPSPSCSAGAASSTASAANRRKCGSAQSNVTRVLMNGNHADPSPDKSADSIDRFC
jgi:hypothetical protein